MANYPNFDAALEAARGVSNRTAFYNQNMQARRANTSKQYVARNAAALAARQKAKGTNIGGWKGALADVMESPVGKALKTLDLSRSYVASHVSDFAQEVEQGDVGGAIGALGRGVGLGAVGEIADAVQGKGFDVAGIVNSYENEKNRKDMWAHTGVGTYLQRGLDKHTWDDGTILNNRGVKIGIGLAGDIGLDPITWATGGIKGSVQAVGRGIMERVGVLITEAGEKAAQAAAAKGASAAEQAIARAAAEGLAKETELVAAREAVATVGKKGASGLSGEQAVKYFPKTHHGVGLRVPFTGRGGRLLGYKGEEVVIPLLPRKVTNPIVRKLAVPRNALRATEFGGKLGTKLSGAAPESYKLLRSGDPEKAWQGIELRTAVRKGNAYNAAGMRLLEDNGFKAIEGGAADGTGRLGKRATEVFRRNIVKDLNLTQEEMKTARNAIESISDPAELVKIKGATELKSFLHEMYRVAEREGVPIEELDNYFPRILTDEWKQARGYSQGTGVGTGRPASTRARTILPQAGETNATVRENMNRLAQDTGVDVGFYEDDVIKTMEEYIKGMTNAVARRRVLGHLRDTGVLLDDTAMPFKFKLKQQANFAKVKQGIDKTLNSLKGEVDTANKTAAESQVAADAAQSELQQVIPEAAAQGDRAYNSVLEELQLQGRTPVRPQDIDLGNEVINRAVNSGKLDMRILDHLTPTQLDNALVEYQALVANRGETRTFGDWLNTRFEQWEQGRVPQPRSNVRGMNPEGEIRLRGGQRGPQPRIRGGAHPDGEVAGVQAERVAAVDAEVNRLIRVKSEIQQKIVELENKIKQFPNASQQVKQVARERLSSLRQQLTETERAIGGASRTKVRLAGTDFGSQFESATGKVGTAEVDMDIADAAQAQIEQTEQLGMDAAKERMKGKSPVKQIVPPPSKISSIDRYVPEPSGDPQLDQIWASRAARHESSAGAGIRGGHTEVGTRSVTNIAGSSEFGPKGATDLFTESADNMFLPEGMSPKQRSILLEQAKARGPIQRKYSSMEFLNKLAGANNDTVAGDIMERVISLRGESARADELFEEGMSIYAHAAQIGDEQSMEIAQWYIKEGEKTASELKEIRKAAEKAERAARAAEAKAAKEARLARLDEQLAEGSITQKEYDVIKKAYSKGKKAPVVRLTDKEQTIVEFKRMLAQVKPRQARKMIDEFVAHQNLSADVADVIERQYLDDIGAFDPKTLSSLGYGPEAREKAAREVSDRLASIGFAGNQARAIGDLRGGETAYGSLAAQAYTPDVMAETYGDIAKVQEIYMQEHTAAERYNELLKTDPEYTNRLDEYARQIAELEPEDAGNLLRSLRANGELSVDDIAMIHSRIQPLHPEFDSVLGDVLNTEFRATAKDLFSRIEEYRQAIIAGETSVQQAMIDMTDRGIIGELRSLQTNLADRVDLHFGWTRGGYSNDISNLEEALLSVNFKGTGKGKAVSVWQGATGIDTTRINKVLQEFVEFQASHSGMKPWEIVRHFYENVLPRIQKLGGHLRPEVIEVLNKRANNFELIDSAAEHVTEILFDLKNARTALDEEATRLGIKPRIRGNMAVEKASASETARDIALARKNKLNIAWDWSRGKSTLDNFDQEYDQMLEEVMRRARAEDAAAKPTEKLFKKNGELSARGQKRLEKIESNVYNEYYNESSRGYLNAMRISHDEVAATEGINKLVETVEPRGVGWGNKKVVDSRWASGGTLEDDLGLFESALNTAKPKPVKAPPSAAMADAIANAPEDVQQYVEIVYSLSESDPEILAKITDLMADPKHVVDGKLTTGGKKAFKDLILKEQAKLLAEDTANEANLVDNVVNETADNVVESVAPEVAQTGDDVGTKIARIKELAARDSSLPDRAAAILKDPKYFDPETGLTKAGAKKLDGMIKFAESKTGAAVPAATTPAVETADSVVESVAEEATQQVEQRAAKGAKSAEREAYKAKRAARAQDIDTATFADRIKAASSADSGLAGRIKNVMEDPKFLDSNGVVSERGVIKIDNMIKNVEQKIAEGSVPKATKVATEAPETAVVPETAPPAAVASTSDAFGPLWDDPAVAAERRAALAASPEAQAQVDAILLDPANKTQKGALRRSARRELNRIYASVAGGSEGATKAAGEAAGVAPQPVAEIAPTAPVEAPVAGVAARPRSVPFEAKLQGGQAAWQDATEVERRMGMLTERQQKQLRRILDKSEYQSAKGLNRSGVTAANRAWSNFAKNAPKAGAVDVGRATTRIVADQQVNAARDAEELVAAAGGAGGGAVPPPKPPTGGAGEIPPDPFEAAKNARLEATKQAMGIETTPAPMSKDDLFASHVEGISSADPAAAAESSDNLFADAIGTAVDARSSAARIRSILTDRSDFTNILDEQIQFVKTQGRGSPQVVSALEKARAVSTQADELLDAARQTTNEAGRAALVHVAEARRAEAQFLTSQRFYDEAVRTAEQNIALTSTQERIREAIASGAYQELASNPNLYTPREIAEALNRVGKVTTPEGFKKFLKHYDTLVGWLKRWQVATPGFHLRNYLGGTFNNYLADVEIGSVAKFRKAYKAWQRGTLPPQESENMARLLEYLGGGQYGNAELGAKAGMSLKPWASDFAPIQVSAKAGENVEFYLRGGLGWDRLLKGQTLDTAIDDIVRYHFDYADLSAFERGTVKRFIPFYTWTRYNMPLQMEMIASSPNKYTKYFIAKNEIESMSDPEKIVPSYIANDLFGIRTPFGKTGQRLYITPDLPFTQTIASSLPDFKNFNPRQAKSYTGLADNYLSMMTPVVKTPLEFMKGEQFFKGIPLPKDRKHMDKPFMFNNALGRTLSEFAGGQGRAAYAVEQFAPPYARARRLFPNEGKYEQRRGASVASFFGLPLRTNTKSDIESEILRRRFAAAAAKKK
jgi:hypothetical protein